MHAEKALAYLNRALAVAGAAGFDLCAGLGAAAVAKIAGVPTGNTDLRFLAAGCLFQRDLHGIAQVVAPKHLAPATAAAALLPKHITKNIAKGLGKTGMPFAAAAHIGVYASMAVLVIGRTFLRVGQHLVGFFGLFEFFFGNLGSVALIAVRVVLHRLLAIGFLDFFVRGVLGNTQHLVVVSFCHV